MEIRLHQAGKTQVAEIVAQGIIIKETQDALDLMADCGYQGADSIILYEDNLAEGFFDLKTRIAGEILQKFSTYNMRLAIVGSFEKYQSKSLNDFIFESNKYGRVCFVNTLEEAKLRLGK